MLFITIKLGWLFQCVRNNNHPYCALYNNGRRPVKKRNCAQNNNRENRSIERFFYTGSNRTAVLWITTWARARKCAPDYNPKPGNCVLFNNTLMPGNCVLNYNRKTNRCAENNNTSKRNDPKNYTYFRKRIKDVFWITTTTVLKITTRCRTKEKTAIRSKKKAIVLWITIGNFQEMCCNLQQAREGKRGKTMEMCSG